MKKLLFIGGYFPPNYQKYIEQISKGVIQYSSNTFQWTYIDGLTSYFDVELITSPFTGNFPKKFKKLYTKSFSFEYKGNEGYSIGTIKLPIINLITRGINLFIYLLKNKKKNIEVIIYCPHLPFLFPVVFLKKYLNYHIGVIVPDLQIYSSSNSNVLFLQLKKIENYMINNLLKKVDYIVTVTDQMSEYYKSSIGKDCIRIEGMYNSSFIDVEQDEKSDAIMYAGTLDARYGIMNLIDAFKLLNTTKYELWIFGEGDMKKAIESISLYNNKIKYYGQKSHFDILKYLQKAKVLVNPRTSDGDYTKYSFPIKTMEYLASGTPTVMHHLAGIPNEYLNYLYIAKEENANGLKDVIETVLSLDCDVLTKKTIEAKKFIINQKSPVKTVYKIYEYVKNKR